MAEFRTITVYETEDNFDLWAYIRVNPDAIAIQEICFPSSSPYLANFYVKFNEQYTYNEIHIIFHDQQHYDSWYDELGAIHDAYRNLVDTNLRAMNVKITRYFSGVDKTDPHNTRPLVEFISKLQDERI